jgi:hypothetical protein
LVIEGFSGYAAETPPQWKPVPTQAGLVEVQPAVLSGLYGWEQTLPAPFRAAFVPPSPAEVWPEELVIEGFSGYEAETPPQWKPVPAQAGLVEVQPAVLSGLYGWEQTLSAPFRAAFVPPSPAEVWPEELVIEGFSGYAAETPPQWKPIPAQAGLVEVQPAVLSGLYGWELALPTPFRAAFVPPAVVEACPSELVVEALSGYDAVLPPLWKSALAQPELVGVHSAVLFGVYGWEQTLPAPFRAAFVPPSPAEVWPEELVIEGFSGYAAETSPQWKPVPAQAGLVEVLPAVLFGLYGWEQTLPALFRAAFVPPSPAEVWPEELVIEGFSGYAVETPPQWKPVPSQAGLVEVQPAVLSGLYGWEQLLSEKNYSSEKERLKIMSLLLAQPLTPLSGWCPDLLDEQRLFRTSRMLEAEVVTSVRSEDVGSYELTLPSRQSRFPVSDKFSEVPASVIFGSYGWEHFSPEPRRISRLVAAFTETSPTELIIEVSDGYEAVLPLPWKPAVLQARIDEVQPTILTGFSGWEQVLPVPFRAAISSFFAFEAWPEEIILEGLGGYEAVLPPQWKSVARQAIVDDVQPVLLVGIYGWEQSLPAPFRAAIFPSLAFEAWPEEIILEGLGGYEAVLPPQWKSVARQAIVDDVQPGLLVGAYGWEQSLSATFRAAIFPSLAFEAWPKEIVLEGFGGYEAVLPPQWKPVASKSIADDVQPSLLVGNYGWDQSLPAPFRAAIVLSFAFEAWPEEIILEGFGGYEAVLPPQWKPVASKSIADDVQLSLLVGNYGWEQSLPAPFRAAIASSFAFEAWPEEIILEGLGGYEAVLPLQWRSVASQSSVDDVQPVLLVGAYGWEQSLPAPFRAAIVSSFAFEAWPEEIILEGFGGYEVVLPPQWKPVASKSIAEDVQPSLLVGNYGWEQSLTAPVRAAITTSFVFEAWGKEIILEAPAGYEAILPSQWKPVAKQPIVDDAQPTALRGTYGWEPFLSSPFRAAICSSFAFEAWPEEIILEGLGGYEAVLPTQWKMVPSQSTVDDVYPGLLVGSYGWEHFLPLPFRAAILSSFAFEAWPEEIILDGLGGYEAVLPSQRRVASPQPQLGEAAISLMTSWGWELPAPIALHAASKSPQLNDAFFTIVRPSQGGYDSPDNLLRTYRLRFHPEILGNLIVGHRDGWENSFAVRRSIKPSVSVIETLTAEPRLAWAPETTSVLLKKLGGLSVGQADVLPPTIVPVIYPWGNDFVSLQSRPGSKFIMTDDWWPLAVQPKPLLPGGYKPWSIFEGRNEDRDFINRVELTIEAIDDELLSLLEEPTEDDLSGYLVAEPIVQSTRHRAVRGVKRSPAVKVQAPSANCKYAADLDRGVRVLIENILAQAKRQGIGIIASEAFRTAETARVHGQLVQQGTDAWVLRLNGDARADVAKAAVAKGFRLLSFDDNSLSFIHRPTEPWNRLLF